MNIRAEVNSAFLKRAMSAPYLEKEEEQNLAQAWALRKDKKALDILITAHVRLVIASATRFRHFGLSASDLIQEGVIGLMEAANRFDVDKDVRFSTYATWWIRASMQDYILKNWSIVRGGTSSSQKALFFNLKRLRNKLEYGEDMTTPEAHTEIARKLGISEKEVVAMDARLSSSDQSFNVTLGDEDGAERMEFLADDRDLSDDVQNHLDRQKKALWIKKAFKALTKREIQILKARRFHDDSATLDSLGDRLGISKERVRQIEKRALEKMRKELLSLTTKEALIA